MKWQIRLRKKLLLSHPSKWNALVREFTAWLEKPYIRRKHKCIFPYNEGDYIIIGPTCFAKSDGSVLSWRGWNYEPQPDIPRGATRILRPEIIANTVDAFGYAVSYDGNALDPQKVILYRRADTAPPVQDSWEYRILSGDQWKHVTAAEAQLAARIATTTRVERRYVGNWEPCYQSVLHRNKEMQDDPNRPT